MTKLTVGGFVVDVVVAEGRAYLAAGSRGVHIVDVSDPLNPVRLGGVDTVSARRLDVSGDLVVVAGGSTGVHVIDASDPTAPFVAGSTHTRPGSRSAAADVAVRGRRAWVADGSGFRLGGLRAIDFSEPTTPVVVGSTSDAFGLSGVALERDFAVTSDVFFTNAVPVFNVGSPAPAFSAALDFSGPPSFRDDEGSDVAVQNGLVFLTGARGPGAKRSPWNLGDSGLHIGRFPADPDRAAVPLRRHGAGRPAGLRAVRRRHRRRRPDGLRRPAAGGDRGRPATLRRGASTVEGDLTASASAQVAGQLFAAESSPAAPVAGGITDIGDIELAEVSDECPCPDPSSWDGADVWQFVLDLLADFAEISTCTDNLDVTALEISEPDLTLAASVDAVTPACRARVLLDGQDLTESLEIFETQIASCREILRSAAQIAGLACSP